MDPAARSIPPLGDRTTDVSQFGSSAGNMPTGRRDNWIVCPTPPDDLSDRGCWFCGSGLTSSGPRRRAREHVFAQWLLDEFDARKRPFGVTWTGSGELEILATSPGNSLGVCPA